MRSGPVVLALIVHGIVPVWIVSYIFETLIHELLMSELTPIAKMIVLSGSFVDNSQDCSRVDCVRLTLINEILVPG